MTSRFRAALVFRKAKSMAAWSIMARFVASDNLASRAVSICEGPCGATCGDKGGVAAFGVPGVGVASLQAHA